MNALKKAVLLLLVVAVAAIIIYKGWQKLHNGDQGRTRTIAPLRDPQLIEIDDAFELAQDALNNMKIGWNLGNSLDCTGSPGDSPYQIETAWGNPPVTQELIHAVKEAGFSAVRVPITWDTHIDADYMVEEEWMSRVEEVVNMILAEDLYCIINVHHDVGSGESWLRADDENYEEMSARFAALWEQIALRFSDYDEHLLFEGFNEITDRYSTKFFGREGVGEGDVVEDEAFSVANRLNQLFVDTVRATGGNNRTRNLVCSSYYASMGGNILENFVLPQDSVEGHLIVQIHSYDPIAFTFKDVNNERAVFDDACRESIDYDFSKLKRYFGDNNIPVIIGEFGAMNKDNPKDRAAYARYFTQKAMGAGIAVLWWDNGIFAEFQLLDRETNTIAFPEIMTALVEESTNN